jgi:flagellar motor switch protein FliM
MSEVLSQGEVDALLRGVDSGNVETETDQPEEVAGVVPYDLTSQEKVIRGRLPTLDIINQMFSRLFRTSFSAMMRKPVDVATVSTDTLKFSDFLRTQPVPSSLHIFRMEPFRGHGLFIVESRLVFSIVDTFFGGDGSREAKITGRDFSSIEIRMTKNVVLTALQDLEKAWKPVHSVTTTYVRSEVNPQFAAIVPPSDVVLVIVFDIEVDSVSGTLTICFPYNAMEPILPKLKAQFQSEEMEVDRVWLNRLKAELLDTELELVVELGTTTLTPGQLLDMKVGDTLSLGKDVTDPLKMKIEGLTKFMGFPGTSKGNKAVKIEEVIR